MTIDIRAVISDSEIKATIQQMAADGEKITNRSLREKLGGGSPNRIIKVLREWREASKPAEPAKAVLSETLQSTYAEIITQQRSAVAAPLLAEIAALQAEADDATNDNERLEQQVIELLDSNAALDEQQKQASAVANERQQRIEQLEAEQTRLLSQVQEQTQLLANANAQLAMQQQQNQQQQAQIEQQAAAVTEANQQTAAAQQAAAVAEAKQQAATETATAAQKRIERLEQQLEQSQAQAVAKLDALQVRLDDAQQQRAADAQAHTKQLAQRDEQLHTEHQKNKQLMSTVDELNDKLKAAEAKKGAK